MTLAEIQTLIIFLFVHQDFLKYTSKAGLDCEEIEVSFFFAFLFCKSSHKLSETSNN